MQKKLKILYKIKKIEKTQKNFKKVLEKIKKIWYYNQVLKNGVWLSW